MKNQKHTPGPWKTGNTIGFRKFIFDSEDKKVCTIDLKTEPEINLAKHLIAAAPEMLEALSRVFNECRLEGCTSELNDLILSAIKKARGESC